MSKSKRGQYLANLLRWLAVQIETNPMMADSFVDAILEGINFTLPLLPKTILKPSRTKVPVKVRKPDLSKLPPLKYRDISTDRLKKRMPKGLLINFDTFDVLAQGGKKLLYQKLNSLNINQLKKIVAQHGFDPAGLARKWKAKERLIKLIIDRVEARSKKGDVFRKY